MTLARWFLLFSVWPLLAAVLPAEDPKSVLVFPGANKRETYFTIHNLGVAQALSTGRGIKVGILDHSFGMKLHPKLYAEGRNFVKGGEESLLEHEWHGYWMATVLREIAPEAEIYALNIIVFDDTAATMDAMSRAIDWAVERRLDVITYSQEAVHGEPRKVLDRALDRAHKAGIVTTFIHCSEPGNILPSGLWSGTDDGREPDVNVLQYDYSIVFIDEYRKAVAGEKTWYQPFLSVSSTAPVVAGVVALMKGLKPDLTPAQCKAILRETARPLEFEGETAPRTLDARAAVSRVQAMR